MKAAVCYEFSKPLVVEEIDIDPPKRSEVKVHIGATAICHSDIHSIKGELGGGVPAVPGHESAGWVEELGGSHLAQTRRPGSCLSFEILRALSFLPHRETVSLRSRLASHDRKASSQ